MQDDLVSPGLLLRRHFFRILPRIAVGQNHRPSVAVHPHLVHPHPELLAPVGKAGVENKEIPACFRLIKGGVMPGGPVGGSFGRVPLRGLEAVAAHQLHAIALVIRIVKKGAGLSAAFDHLLPQRVHVGAVRIPAPADPDIVTVRGIQAAEGQKQIIVIRVRTVQNIRSLDPGVVFAQQFFAVSLAFQGKTGLRIHLQNINPAGIAAVDHPEASVLIEKHAWINDVGQFRRVIAGPAALQENPQIPIGALRPVTDRQSQGAQRAGAFAGAVIQIIPAVPQLLYIRRPEGRRFRVAQGFGHLLLHMIHQFASGIRVPREHLPAHQIRAAGRCHVAAEDIERSVGNADDRRIVDADLPELRFREGRAFRAGGKSKAKKRRQKRQAADTASVFHRWIRSFPV